MPRKPIPRSNEHYYHITARSNNREFFYLPAAQMWEIMTKRLFELQCEFQIIIPAFVLMDNHFHLMILTPHEGLDRIMYFLMKRVTLDIQKSTGRINKIFGGRYKGSLIGNENYLWNVYKYILRNPVEAGLIERAEDYAFSSLFYQVRPSENTPFKIQRLLPLAVSGDENELKWINQNFREYESKSIRGGLRKTIFAYEVDRATGKAIGPQLLGDSALT